MTSYVVGWLVRTAWAVALLAGGPDGADPAPRPEPPAAFDARVVGIVDGDTVDVLWRRTQVRIRLAGIDTPERGQPFGKRATRHVGELARGRTVRVVGAANDRHGRRVAELLLPDGRSINRELVRDGLAWHFVKYSDDATLAALEGEARAAKRGLWADKEPIAPWDWRRRKQATREATPAAPLPPGMTVGNRRSSIYHAPGCPDRERVSARNRVLFDTEEEAAAAGFRRARNCPARPR